MAYGYLQAMVDQGVQTDGEPLRIAIADDHAVVRTGLHMLLDDEAGFEVVAEAADVDAAKRAVRGHKPDVLVLDLNMPGAPSLPAIPELAVIVTWSCRAGPVASAHEATISTMPMKAMQRGIVTIAVLERCRRFSCRSSLLARTINLRWRRRQRYEAGQLRSFQPGSGTPRTRRRRKLLRSRRLGVP